MIKMQFIGATMVAMTQGGALPTTPVIFPLSLTENNIKAKEQSKELKFVGECCGNQVVFGAKEVTGSFGGVLTSSSAAVMMQHMFGEFDTIVDATTQSWEATTVMAFGDTVNHSDGTHSLVCTKSGTTAATEPTIVETNKKIIDGTANWVATPLMKKGSTTTSKKSRAVAVEHKFKKDDGTFFYVRYENVTFSKTDIASVGKEIEMKWSMDATGARVTDSLDDGFVSLADIAGAKSIEPLKDLYMNNESTGGTCAFRDGVAVDEYDEMSFTVERKVEKSTSVPKQEGNEFVARPPKVPKDITAKGKFRIYANKTDYQNFKEHTPFDAKISLQNDLGSKVSATFKGVVPSYSDISIKDCMDSKLESELSVTGACGDTAPVTIEVIYPQLVDDNGAALNYFA